MHPALRDCAGPPSSRPSLFCPRSGLVRGRGLFTECLPDHLSVHGAASLQGVEPVAQAPAPSGLAAAPPQEVRVRELTKEQGRVSDARRADATADSPFTPITLWSFPHVSNQPTQNSMITMGLWL